MAFPSFIGAGTPGEGLQTCIPTLHASTQQSDLLMCFMETDDQLCDAAGFAFAEEHARGLGTRLTTFWKRATSGEPNPTCGKPLFVNGETTTEDNCLVVGTICHGNDVLGAAFAGYTNSDLANITERFDDSTNVSGGGGLAVFTGEKASAGPYRATTFTTSLAGNPGWASFSFALRPSGASIPTFVAAGTSSASAGSADATPGLPAGIQVDDLLLVFVETDDEYGTEGQKVITVDGYQHLGKADVVRQTETTKIDVFWKRAGASESAPVVQGATLVDHKFAVCLAFRGVATSGPPYDVISAPAGSIISALNHIYAVVLTFRDGFATGLPWDLITPGGDGTSNSVTLPGTAVGTTSDECLVLGACAHSADTASPNFSGYANPDLANITELFDGSTTQGNGGGIGVFSGELGTAGPFGSTTISTSLNPAWAGYHFALLPATPSALAAVEQIIRY